MRPDDPSAEERRRIIRRAALYTYGLAALVLAVTFGGAALIALFVRVPDVSFVKRWLAISALVLVPAFILFLIQNYRENRRDPSGPDSGRS